MVCIREVQRSLNFSVKRLIESKIAKFEVGPLFDCQRELTRTPGGGVIIYQGMQNHTADSIKSLEGFDVAWFEESHTASDHSLTLLRPTLRKSGSELWFSWNPEREDAPIEKLLRGEKRLPDDTATVVAVTYRDNPFLPDEMRLEIERDKARDPAKYHWVWEGGYLRKSEAQVFKNWRVEDFDTPDDAQFRLGADWGFSVDPTVLIRLYVVGRTIYIDREVYKIGCEIDQTPALFDQIDPGDVGVARKWPMRADSARPETISYMRRNGYPKIERALKGKGSVEDGVAFLQSYDIVVHPRCRHMIEELTLYCYKTDKLTDEVLPVLEDANNHCIDAARYALESLRRATGGRVLVGAY